MLALWLPRNLRLTFGDHPRGLLQGFPVARPSGASDTLVGCTLFTHITSY
jgi:hypothetical protein